MRMQRTRREDPRSIEIQDVHSGDAVRVHMIDGRKVLIEQGAGAEFTISIKFGHSKGGVVVYDDDGEELGTIRPLGYIEEDR